MEDSWFNFTQTNFNLEFQPGVVYDGKLSLTHSKHTLWILREKLGQHGKSHQICLLALLIQWLVGKIPPF